MLKYMPGEEYRRPLQDQSCTQFTTEESEMSRVEKLPAIELLIQDNVQRVEEYIELKSSFRV